MGTYNPNVPLGPQIIAQTQAPIQANFADIQAAQNNNHGPLGSGTEGQHVVVQLPAQLSVIPVNPGVANPTLASTDIALYNGTSTVNGSSNNTINMVFGSASTAPISISDSLLAGSINGRFGWTCLPSGLILKWGTAVSTNNFGPGTFTYDMSVEPGANTPFKTAIYSVNVCMGGSNDAFITPVNQGVWTTITFQYYVSARTTTGPALGGTVFFTYWAVGV